LNHIDECKNNISERNKVLFSKAEKEKFGKMGNEKRKKKRKKNSSIVVWNHQVLLID
jgi:hypothetical protein